METIGIIKIESIKKLPNIWFENGAVYVATSSGRKRIDIKNENEVNGAIKMEWPETR